MAEHIKNLHLIPGVSASGKTSMARFLASEIPNAQVVVGYTTRLPRPGEQEGVDYCFRDLDHFNRVIANRDDNWRSSKIGSHHYYNSDRNTIPNSETTTKILPVSYSALNEVLKDYTPLMDNGIITIAPLVISHEHRNQWLSKVESLRPTRNLKAELDEQDALLNNLQFDGIYIPSWEWITDCENYINLYRAIISTRINSQ